LDSYQNNEVEMQEDIDEEEDESFAYVHLNNVRK